LSDIKRNLEGDLVVGNIYNKSNPSSFVHSFLIRKFEEDLLDLIGATGAKKVHEVGCGGGDLARIIVDRVDYYLGSDISTKMIDASIDRFKGAGNSSFACCSIYDLDKTTSAELIICCEVLEHIDDPMKGLQILKSITEKYLILSVPREPIWRMCNMLRGAYLSNLGNTPGHIQHWSKKSFLRMVGEVFDIIEIRTPFPWTMVLCTIKTS
jgi:2-polyprenyl-3-methyl-5-hydroxy-6-metoxy-1,4-benzoquinol methylase